MSRSFYRAASIKKKEALQTIQLSRARLALIKEFETFKAHVLELSAAAVYTCNYPSWINQIQFKTQQEQVGFIEELIAITKDTRIPRNYIQPLYLYEWYQIVERRNKNKVFVGSSLHHEMALFFEFYGTRNTNGKEYKLLLSIPMQHVCDLKTKHQELYYDYLIESLTFKEQIRLVRLIRLAEEKEEELYLHIGFPLLEDMVKGMDLAGMITKFIREGLPIFLNKVPLNGYSLKEVASEWFQLWLHHQHPGKCKLARFKGMSEISHIPLAQIVNYLPVFLLKGDFLFDPKLYPHLGAGKNIRSLEPYQHLSKRMAHEFLNSGEIDWEICRYTLSYLLAIGCSLQLSTTIGRHLTIRKSRFSKAKMNRLKKWTPIILKLKEWFPRTEDAGSNVLQDILAFCKHCEDEQKAFSIKGRTLASMRRLVAGWHEQNICATLGPKKIWKGAPYQIWEEEKEDRLFQIVQLTDSHQLHIEGNYMRHCVGTYVRKCVHAHASIWSLREQLALEEWIPKATIEVNNRGSIIQVRGKYNGMPKLLHQQMVKAWAEREQLQLVE